MVVIDVTSPFTAGINAASSASRGILTAQEQAHKQRLQEEQFNLLKRKFELESTLANEEANQRRAEIERIHNREMGQTSAIEKYLGFRGRGFKPGAQLPYTDGGKSSFWGDPSQREDDEESQLEEYLQQQRNDTHQWLAGFTSESARNVAAREILPLLVQDEQDERHGLAARKMVQRGKEALGSGLLDEEEQAVIQMGLDGLIGGLEDAGSFGKMLATIAGSVRKRIVRQQNFMAGQTLAQNEIGRVMQGGGDPAPLHKAFSKWVTDQDGDYDPRKLDIALQEARLGTKLGRIKIGKLEVSPQISAGQFKSIAVPEASREAREEVGRNPVFQSAIRAGKWTPEIDAQYQEQLRDATRVRLMQYWSQMGQDPETFGFVFPIEPASDSDIDSAFKKAGIDPRVLDKEYGNKGTGVPFYPPPPVPQKQGNVLQGRQRVNTGVVAPSENNPNDSNGDNVIDENDLGIIHG